MKFCNLLRETAEGLPEVRDLYLAYKRLKKLIREVVQCKEAGNVEESVQFQSQFISDVNSCLQQVNETFIEKEEEVVILFDNLERAAIVVQSLSESQRITQRFADFHGKLLLFMNTTMLTYVCILKIMKKYHKKTGQVVLNLQPAQLREMPIGSTEIISSIVFRAEQNINSLISKQKQFLKDESSNEEVTGPSEVTGMSEVDQKQGSETQVLTISLIGQIRLALGTWEQLKSTAVTPSTVLTDRILTLTSSSASTAVSSTSSSVKSEAS